MEKPVVKLIGEDGNCYFILGKIIRTLRRNGYSQEEIEKYKKEATSGNYENLLYVTSQYVTIE